MSCRRRNSTGPAQHRACRNHAQPNATPGTYGLTADGTWDCNDAGGTYLGAIVVADLSYAFINPDQSVGTYGTLKMDEWLDHPAFFILTGELRDSFAAVGLSITGPDGNPELYTNWDKLRLEIVISEENQFYCTRRKGPAT